MTEEKPNCTECNYYYTPYRVTCNACIWGDYINYENTVIDNKFTPVVFATTVNLEVNNER